MAILRRGSTRIPPSNSTTLVSSPSPPAAQRWPLWPYVLRAFSILLGLGVVLLTYLTARVLVRPPAPAAVALAATAFAALLPQANFIRASIANENLADFFAAWLVLLLV